MFKDLKSFALWRFPPSNIWKSFNIKHRTDKSTIHPKRRDLNQRKNATQKVSNWKKGENWKVSSCFTTWKCLQNLHAAFNRKQISAVVSEKAVQSFMQNLLAESLTWEPLQLFTVCFSIVLRQYQVFRVFPVRWESNAHIQTSRQRIFH